jgi:hypothetical protein
MSEPVYTVDCPYCSALVAVFKDSSTATCRACGGVMRLLHSHEQGYSDAETELKMLKKVRMKE